MKVRLYGTRAYKGTAVPVSVVVPDGVRMIALDDLIKKAERAMMEYIEHHAFLFLKNGTRITKLPTEFIRGFEVLDVERIQKEG